MSRAGLKAITTLCGLAALLAVVSALSFKVRPGGDLLERALARPRHARRGRAGCERAPHPPRAAAAAHPPRCRGRRGTGLPPAPSSRRSCATPLADPYLLGLSGGGGLGAVLVLVTGVSKAAPLILPVAAFAGALVAVLLVYRLASER